MDSTPITPTEPTVAPAVEQPVEPTIETPTPETAEETPKVLTNIDVLRSHGLVEIYDPSVAAFRQVKIADAKKMVENLEDIKKQLENA